MNELRDAAVKRYDVVVVGGGIAGIAIAERLAREAVRQNKRIRILLIEQEESLGTAASGGLEGWGHTGALYSKERSTRFFAHFLSAFEDLYNWYHFDPLFKFKEHCNLQDIEKAERPAYDFPFPPSLNPDQLSNLWFLGPITYLLPDQPDSMESNKDHRDIEEWQRIRTRVRALVQWAFFKQKWVSKVFGCCQAPYVEEFDGTSAHDPPPQSDPRVQKPTQTELPPGAFSLEDVMARAGGPEAAAGESANLQAMPSCDAAVNTRQVLRDLTEAAVLMGVEILCGYKMDPQSIQISPYGTVDQVTGLLLTPTKANIDGAERESQPDGVHVIADQYIFALGIGFEEGKLMHSKLDVHVKVQKKLSVMVVTRPPLCDFSFVRMDLHSRNDFNHIYRQSLEVNAAAHLRIRAVDHLLDKAGRYFGNRLQEREFVGWYICTKTEFPETGEQERDYSYYWGPKWGDWDEGKWETIRVAERRTAQESILNYVASGAQGIPDRDGWLLFESSWALKKAIHFALQRLAKAERLDCSLRDARQPRDAIPKDYEVFRRLRDYVILEFAKRNKRQPTRRPNFLCVIPGKFSLFPTLAHQVYIEMEVRGMFQRIKEEDHAPPQVKTEDELNALVAVPRAQAVLSKLERCFQRRQAPGSRGDGSGGLETNNPQGGAK
jgi:hypothetical protein